MTKYIKTVEKVIQLATKKKSVDVHYGGNLKNGGWVSSPAAFVQNYQAFHLVTLLKANRVREHVKKV